MNGFVKIYEREAQRGLVGDRDELVLSHLPLVRFLVGRMANQLPSHVDQDELVSAACLGLIQAARRFDPARGVKFKTFAEQHIKGTIIDELRAQDRLSRPLRGKFKRLESEFAVLEQKLGRTPNGEEVAAAMEIPIEEYHQLLKEVHCFTFTSLDDNCGDNEGSLLDIIEDKGVGTPQEQMISREMLDGLAAAIEALPEKERLVITLYYYEELTLKEIGEVMNLTESRISQLNSQAIIHLRAIMKSHV